MLEIMNGPLKGKIERFARGWADRQKLVKGRDSVVLESQRMRDVTYGGIAGSLARFQTLGGP